jgi:hypothetical protein
MNAQTQVNTINPRPGDTVIVSYPGRLSVEQEARIREVMKGAFPQCLVVLAAEGFRVSILGGDERMQRVEEALSTVIAQQATLIKALTEIPPEEEEEPQALTLDGEPAGQERDQTQGLG